MDWESIFVNLILNSAWALQGTIPENRRIRVKMTSEGSYVTILFEDSGIGLEAGTEEAIFEATFTTKRNQRGEAAQRGEGNMTIEQLAQEFSEFRRLYQLSSPNFQLAH